MLQIVLFFFFFSFVTLTNRKREEEKKERDEEILWLKFSNDARMNGWVWVEHSTTNLLKLEGLSPYLVSILTFPPSLSPSSLVGLLFLLLISRPQYSFDIYVSVSFYFILFLSIDSIEYFSSKVSDKSQDIQWNNNRSTFIVQPE